jgi:GT2 family glycosyltransferase
VEHTTKTFQKSDKMTIDLVFITYNRLHYTKLALASVLSDPAEEFRLTIWDNGSTDGTVEYLRNEVNDPRVTDIILSKTNVGQTCAVNEIWGRSKADLLGKLDNDCIVSSGWARMLAQAHEDIDNLGVIACWHFPIDDFDESSVRKAGKIQIFNGHQIFRHPWTCGTGLLIKRNTFKKFGPMLVGGATTKYWLRIALAGYVNGYYYPFVFQEHMDDPKSSHCILTDDESVQKMRNTTRVLRKHNINNIRDRWKRRKVVLKNLNCDPWEAKYYVGWRRKLQGIKRRVDNFIRSKQSWRSSL